MTQNIGLYCINSAPNKNSQSPKGVSGEKCSISDSYINADIEAISAAGWILGNIVKPLMTQVLIL